MADKQRGALDLRRAGAMGLIGAVAVELVTAIMRFGFGLQSTRDTATTIGIWTGGIRIHHGYIGLLACLAAWCVLRYNRRWAQWLLIGGLALVLSDLIHHFVVLWLFVGDPEFHLMYPKG